ncbi:hypothetical protein Cfor_02238 [Coptotermes formosanus]|uniref:Uncharacterized protein n=1 Tax=Coptotermes formosanus TaxID=36987 RepID=A0A6L2Q336_COPFO|nr:hypothetical protein Cfor_02238 [Coptotermes formosanus]
MRSDLFLSKPDALMAGPQSRRKVKKSRWTNAEALNRRRGKSPNGVHSGINSRHGKPLGKQVVLKLEELCRAVLDVRSSKGDGTKTANVTRSGTSQAKQDLKECVLSVVDTSTVSNEESEMTHSDVHGVPAASGGLESDDAKRAHNSVKLEVSETKNCKEQENNLSFEDANMHEVIKTECELDVNSVIIDTVSCKMETVDHLVDVGHKVEQKNVECTEENDGSSSQAIAGDAEDQVELSNQPCQNEAFSNTSGAEYHCCKERDCIYTDPINLAKQSESSIIAAAVEGVSDSVSASGVGCSTDEDAGIGHVEIQKLSGPQLWMGKRKCVSYSLTSSLTEESLDSSVSSGMTVRESLPDSKNDNSKDDIPYSMINCDMMIGSDKDKLFDQEVSDLWSTTGSPVSRYAPPLAPVELSDANSYRCGSHAQSWSPALLPVSSGGRIGSYLEPGTDMPLHYGSKMSDTLPGSPCQDVHMLQPAVPTSYPTVSVSPAASVPQEGMGPENETLKSQEGELFRKIEESLAERETLKYQEKELLKRIERSLTETKSLKCREEQLLSKIERSLTRAKSLKSQEEELLRRIEVSLAQRGTAKSQDEELLVRMETFKDTKCSFVDVDSVSSMEFESENMPDLENSLPLKKRKKWLKTVINNENKEIQMRSTPLESFPSFPLWPMISIAELEAVGKLQQHPSLPSFPSRPMISIAELEAHTVYGRSQQQPCEPHAAAPWVPRYPYYCEENSSCGESFYSRNSVGRTYGEFFEQNSEMIDNTMLLPVFKSEESAERYSCCKMSSGCARSQPGVCNVSYLGKVDAYSDESALSVCSGVAEDSKVDLCLFVRPAMDSVGSKVEADSRVCVESCERTSDPSVELCRVDTDSKDIVGNEVTVQGSECTKDNSEEIGVPECTKDDKIVQMDAKICTEVSEKIGAPVESKCIKVDSVEHCGVLYPPLTDLKYKADVDSETSVAPLRFIKVDVESKDSIALLSSTVNCVEGPNCIVHKGLGNNIELLGESEENLACSKKTKDNAEWCRKIDVPQKESKCVLDVGSKEGFV